MTGPQTRGRRSLAETHSRTPDTGDMGIAVFMTLPGLVILLTLAAFADQLLRDEADGAPPHRTSIDLAAGTALVRGGRS
jgi:hypothetical protein